MHPDRKNIDHHVNLPEGIEFRQDAIWGQIKPKSNHKKPYFWWIAASVALIASVGIFLFSESDDFQENLLMTEFENQGVEIIPLPEVEKPASVSPNENPALIKESKTVPIKSEPLIHEFKDAETKRLSNFLTEVVDNDTTDSVQPTESKAAEIQLSPAAQRLQASLDKVNPKSEVKEKIILQRFTLAEFLGADKNIDLAKESNINQESILSRLKFIENEKN
ncbi:hypothetical protein MM213_06345 [Belliella sp. R4-6]|uniref:Uncharacterized protein n=1 Tax=Belliella alkalica TaxID=1730871 RepID=A0ABS9VA27_9BACT|nr:hypothetical protein [Belliella alkalica]MCH7413094.1 hypothetical protein [Belliella alkalica]